jgi:transketolase
MNYQSFAGNSMRKQFKKTVMELSQTDERLVLVFGDVSVYLFNDFSVKYPERFFNLGICENTIISTSAGLSSQGFHPIAHTIAPFITERSYEQIKLDLCYNKFGAAIVSCGASFDYAWDGATHHSYTDLAILRMLPGMEVIQPGSIHEFDVLFRSRYASGSPVYYRLSDHPHNLVMDVVFGKGVVIKDSAAPVTIMTAGPLLGNVVLACEDLTVNIVYFHTIKPIDAELIERYKHTKIIVVHDAFGLYEAITSVAGVSALYHGIPDEFCCWYGTLEEIRKKIGLDSASIRSFIEQNQRAGGE